MAENIPGLEPLTVLPADTPLTVLPADMPLTVLPADTPPARRPAVADASARTLLAWIIIVLTMLAVPVLRMAQPAASAPASEEAAGDAVMLLQSRLLVGFADLFPNIRGNFHAQGTALNTGSVGQRLRFVVVAGELSGPEEALDELKRFDQALAKSHVQPTATQKSVRRVLGRLYRNFAHERGGGPSVPEADRNLLRTQLGWFGELALHPAGGPDPDGRRAVLRPARRFAMAMIIIGGVFAVLAVAGLAGLTVFLALLFSHRLRRGVRCGLAPGSVYAETFALWMLLFLVLSMAAAQMPVTGGKPLLSSLAMLLSLAALIWPVLRGLAWRQVRQEIGWMAGRQPVLEPIIGPGVYALAMPLLAMAMAVVFVLVQVQRSGQGISVDHFGSNGLPVHPIVGYVSRGGWWERIQVLFAACIAAPIVEETMFRGVLYRHLREASTRLGLAWSFLFSATTVSFIFAVIHPQGLIAVPLLMALAFGFALAREWRGTLVPCMVAHALNNGLVMALLLLALGD